MRGRRTRSRRSSRKQHGRPARRRCEGQSEALARQRRADDLHRQVPTELIVFKRPARFRPDRRHAAAVGGEHHERRADQHRRQQLLRAPRRPLVPLGPHSPGRGRSSPECAAAGLREDSARVARRRRAADVAGTPQAQEAVIENSIPQTATVPLRNGPKFTPNFDGPPRYSRSRTRRWPTWSIRRSR